LQDPELDPLEDATTTTEFQHGLPPEDQVLVNCNSNHNVSSISIKEETFDQDENIGVAQGENGKDINSTEPDVDLPVEHFPNETDNQENATDKAFFDEGNIKKESNIEDSEDEVEILGQTGTEKDSKKRNVEEFFCDGYKPSLKRKRDTPVKHIKIVLPKLKPGSSQSNNETDVSQNQKGNIIVSNVHHDKKKSKGGKNKPRKFECKRCGEKLLIGANARRVEPCKRCYSNFMEKINDNSYQCKLCFTQRNLSRFNMYNHMIKNHSDIKDVETNLDDH